MLAPRTVQKEPRATATKQRNPPCGKKLTSGHWRRSRGVHDDVDLLTRVLLRVAARLDSILFDSKGVAARFRHHRASVHRENRWNCSKCQLGRSGTA